MVQDVCGEFSSDCRAVSTRAADPNKTGSIRSDNSPPGYIPPNAQMADADKSESKSHFKMITSMYPDGHFCPAARSLMFRAVQAWLDGGRSWPQKDRGFEL